MIATTDHLLDDLDLPGQFLLPFFTALAIIGEKLLAIFILIYVKQFFVICKSF